MPLYGGQSIPRVLWADRPSASAAGAGASIIVTDQKHSEWVSDGTYWKPRNGVYSLSVDAAPRVLPGSGTISSDGLLSALTAFPTTFVGTGLAYCFTSAGLTAGWYTCTFVSATSIQLWTDEAATIKPATTAGAYTSGTAQTSVLTVCTVPAGMLVPSSRLEINVMRLNNNTSNAKVVRLFANTTLGVISASQTTVERKVLVSGIHMTQNSTVFNVLLGNDGETGTPGEFAARTVNDTLTNALTLGLTLQTSAAASDNVAISNMHFRLST